MTFETIFDQVASELARIFKCEKNEILPETSAPDIARWDSLNNIKMLITLEQLFKIKFTGLEVSSLENVRELVELIGRKIQN